MSIVGAIVGGVASNLLSSMSKPRAQSSSTQTTSENRRVRSSGTTRETTTLFAEEDLEALRAFLPLIEAGANQFTRDNALQDISGFTSQAIRALREQGIPELFANQAQGGAYGQTMVSLLGNDLTARTAENIAAAGVDAVTRYAGAQSDMFSNLSQLGALLRGAFTQTERTAEGEETTQGTTRGQSQGSQQQSSGQNPFLAALLGGVQAGFNYKAPAPTSTTPPEV